MSGSSQSGTTTPQATPQQMLAMYNQFLPTSLATTAGQAIPTANTLGAAAYSANPIYTMSGLEQLNDLAGGYQRAGGSLAQMQGQSTADLLNGSGGRAAGAANVLADTYNPVQAAANAQAMNLVNSIDVNHLSGGERAAVERSLNQSNFATGNLGLDNATNAVGNAMQFGNALQAKRAALGSALQTATGVSGQQNTNFNPINTALNAGSTQGNFGLGTFNPTQANTNLTAPLSFGSSLGNQIAGVAGASRGTTAGASGGCFLTTTMCEFKGLKDNCEELQVLRAFRDRCVPVNIVQEYYRIAPAIVELVKNNEDYMQYICDNINECVGQIKRCNSIGALETYMKMVNHLKSKL